MTTVSQVDTLDSSTTETVERLAISLPARTSKVCMYLFVKSLPRMRVDKREFVSVFSTHVLVKQEQ